MDRIVISDDSYEVIHTLIDGLKRLHWGTQGADRALLEAMLNDAQAWCDGPEGTGNLG